MASNNTVIWNFVARKRKWWGMHKAAHLSRTRGRRIVFPCLVVWKTWGDLDAADIAFNLFIPWIVVGRLEPDDSWQPQRWPLCPAGKDIWRAATPRYWLVRIRQIKSSLLPPNTNSKWLTGADSQVAWIKTRYITVVIWSIVIQQMSSVMMHITSHCQP